MDPRYAKAKIEEPNPDMPLHLSLLKPDGSPMDNLGYMKIFEDPGKTLQLQEAIASGEIHVRKLHRIRNKELVKFIDKDFEGLKDIHVISKATIGVIADDKSNLHLFLDLLGTADEVKMAEELIIDNVLKTYSSVCFPIILMTPKICWDKINIPLHKVCRLLGSYGNSLLRIEMESGAWIQIEQGPSPGVGEWETVVNISGPGENVNKAKSLIQSAISDQPGELSAVDALNEFVRQFKEPSCDELLDHKKTDDVEPDKKKKQKVPTCLVEGCNADFSNCKDYHRRHKVCEVHFKTSEVSHNGQKQRFCQQCTKFHPLEEFDGEKRNCRMRLDGHNLRRRKPQPDTSRAASLVSGHHGETSLIDLNEYPLDTLDLDSPL